MPNDLNLCFKASATAADQNFHTGWHLQHNTNTLTLPIEHSTELYSATLSNTRIGADIQGPLAWSYNTDCSSKIIAVIDSGIERRHMALKDNIYRNPLEIEDNGIDDDGNGFVDDVYGWNFVDFAHSPNGAGYNNTFDDNGHGTFVTGLIAAAGNDGFGTTGICWKAKVLPIKAFDSSGDGLVSDILEAIDYSRVMGAHVINNSYVLYQDRGSSDAQAYRALYDNVIADLNSQGILFVAAAGNGYDDPDSQTFLPVDIDGSDEASDSDWDNLEAFPASITQPNVITVAASTPTDTLASFSNRGRTLVHIAAPGQNVSSTTMGGLYDTLSGTSFSSPLVAATAALYWNPNPGLSHIQVRDRILQFSDQIRQPAGNDLIQGRRRLNVGRVMRGS